MDLYKLSPLAVAVTGLSNWSDLLNSNVIQPFGHRRLGEPVLRTMFSRSIVAELRYHITDAEKAR